MLRQASELACRVYDFCSESPTSPVTRSRCLLRVVSAAHTLMTSDSSLIGGLSRLPCRLLIRRLQCGPNPAERIFDCKLREILTSNTNLSVEYVSSVMELLRSETWGSPGNELRVSYREFYLPQAEISVGSCGRLYTWLYRSLGCSELAGRAVIPPRKRTQSP
jgi:hypothetical protein